MIKINKINLASKYTLSILIIWLGVMYFPTGCIEPFEPEIQKYENLLVVEGFISNAPPPYHVKLSRSFDFSSFEGEKVRGAIVVLKDNFGNSETFKELTKGNYFSAVNGLQAITGREYSIEIKTADGAIYVSEPEMLKQPAQIDSIFFRVEESLGNNGIQLYINSHDPLNNTRYYEWKYNETWEISSPFTLANIPNICYKSLSSINSILGSTEKNIRDEVKEFPFYYINDQTNRLRTRYSIMVSQYSLTERAYLYLKQLQKVNEGGGTLFDATPMTVKGNLKCTSNPELPVLGYFQVSSVVQKRIFIKRSDLPSELKVPTGFEQCELAITPEGDSIANDTMPPWIPIDTSYVGVFWASSMSCIDCRLSGTAEKPTFW